MDGRIIPVEKPLPGRHLRPLLLEMLHEGPQGLHDVHGVDIRPPGYDVGVNHASGIKEGHHHLFDAAGLDSGFDRAWFALLDPLF